MVIGVSAYRSSYVWFISAIRRRMVKIISQFEFNNCFVCDYKTTNFEMFDRNKSHFVDKIDDAKFKLKRLFNFSKGDVRTSFLKYWLWLTTMVQCLVFNFVNQSVYCTSVLRVKVLKSCRLLWGSKPGWLLPQFFKTYTGQRMSYVDTVRFIAVVVIVKLFLVQLILN